MYLVPRNSTKNGGNGARNQRQVIFFFLGCKIYHRLLETKRLVGTYLPILIILFRCSIYLTNRYAAWSLVCMSPSTRAHELTVSRPVPRA